MSSADATKSADPALDFVDDLAADSDGYMRGIGYFWPKGGGSKSFSNIDIISARNGRVNFNIMTAGVKGKGQGTKAMYRLIGLADEHGVILEGTVKPFGTGKRLTKAQLKKWYKKFGFEVKGDEITRHPVAEAKR